MGQQLVSFYEQAGQLGGMKAKMRMAMITKVPSAQASTAPDSPENVKAFEQAMNELKKEYS